MGRSRSADRNYTVLDERVEYVRPEDTGLSVPVVHGDPGHGQSSAGTVRPRGGENRLTCSGRSADQREWSTAHTGRHAVDQAGSIDDAERWSRREKLCGEKGREPMPVSRVGVDNRRGSTCGHGAPKRPWPSHLPLGSRSAKILDQRLSQKRGQPVPGWEIGAGVKDSHRLRMPTSGGPWTRVDSCAEGKWREWAALMGDSQTYEVRVVVGPLSDQLTAALGVSAVEEPAQTLLRTHPIDQAGLLGLIDCVSGFGLELVEVHRIGSDVRRSHDPSLRPGVADRAALPCYEIAVRGLLGPTWLTALAGTSSASAQRPSSWTFRCSAPRGLAALMQLLAEHDAVVVSLYRVGCTADSAVEDTTNTPSAEPG